MLLQKPKPFLKWPGGKRQLLPQLRSHLPSEFGRYFEPFVGAGALLFDLMPERATIADLNAELINCYQVIQRDFGQLTQRLSEMPNDPEFFYQIRALDKEPGLAAMHAVERAARTIYLNKTCFNGLYRVNAAGHFNASFGKYSNPLICDEWNLLAVHKYLSEGKISIECGGFSKTLSRARAGDLVYLDPPYDETWVGYQAGGFDRKQQQALAELVHDLTKRGVYVMASNSATEFIRGLYSGYHQTIVPARRLINTKSDSRGPVPEALITNYLPGTTEIIERKRIA